MINIFSGSLYKNILPTYFMILHFAENFKFCLEIWNLVRDKYRANNISSMNKIVIKSLSKTFCMYQKNTHISTWMKYPVAR